MTKLSTVVGVLSIVVGLLLVGGSVPVRADPPLPLNGDNDLYEPNDTPSQAYGPLEEGQVYAAYIWNESDVDDYYYFVPLNDGRASISLSHIASSADYDLYLYDLDGAVYQLVARSVRDGAVDENVTLTTVAGRTYYIRVSRYQGFSDLQPYHLVVEGRHRVYLPLVAGGR